MNISSVKKKDQEMIINFYHIYDIQITVGISNPALNFVFQEWAFSILSFIDSWVLSTDLHAHGKDDENDDEENSQTSADYCSNGVGGDWKTENDLSLAVSVNVSLYLCSVFTHYYERYAHGVHQKPRFGEVGR